MDVEKCQMTNAKFALKPGKITLNLFGTVRDLIPQCRKCNTYCERSLNVPQIEVGLKIIGHP